MPVILVIIVAVAWIAILAPNMMRRRTRLGDGISSISTFHHQLRVLEHSAPDPIVAPAYRLQSVGGAGTAAPRTDRPGQAAAPVLTVVGADQLPRPALAFLGRDSDDPPPPPVPQPLVPPRTGPPTRHLVRRRRRDTLGVLAAVFVTTLVVGFLPGAGAAWMVCALSAVALAVYMALLVRLRRVADERTRKLRYLQDQGRRMAGPPTGQGRAWEARFAHPSNQMLAAH